MDDTKLPTTSADLVADKLAALRELVPEVFTEGKIDWNAFRLALGDAVEAGRERFGLDWVGKTQAMQAIQELSTGTLLPDADGSVDFETTRNVIIEGDNLEVLKVLQRSYHGKVKLIFIDPPYNTGKDFIYPDDFKEGLQEYLRFTEQVSQDGIKLRANLETDGRFHSRWLSMLWPRLYLAKNLLKPSGAIFVTIDDHELQNLLHIMDEVFGPENRLGIVAWQKKYATANDTVDFSTTHDYVVVYSKQRKYVKKGKAVATLARLPRTEAMNKPYKNPDNDERGRWKAGDYTCNKSAVERENLYYPITHPNTAKQVWPKRTAVWRYAKEEHNRNVENKRVWWGADGFAAVPAYKRFLSEVSGPVSGTVWSWRDCGHTDEARKELITLFPDATRSFDTPKPTRLLQHIIYLASPQKPKPTEEPDIILDFFAGSGTTGHAVLKQNLLDGGNRQYVLVQLPHPLQQEQDEDDESTDDAFEEPIEDVQDTSEPTIDPSLEAEFEQAHFVPKTVSDITIERMRRVKRVIEESPQPQLPLEHKAKLDAGFRLFRLGSSNFTPWDSQTDTDSETALGQKLLAYADQVKPSAAPTALLFEILLRAGYSLSEHVERKSVAGEEVHIVAGGRLVVCLASDVTEELALAILALAPKSVVFLDSAFGGNDALKANTRLQARSHHIDFRTV